MTFIVVSTYKTFYNFSDFFTLHTLIEFLLPLILSMLLIPFFYFLALFIQYETLFVRIDFMQVMAKEKRTKIKRQILITANISLNKISAISQRISKFDLHNSTDIRTTIRELISTPTVTDDN